MVDAVRAGARLPPEPAEEYVYALLPPPPPVPLRGGLEVVGAWVEPPAESAAGLLGPSPPGPMEKASNFSTSGASTALPL